MKKIAVVILIILIVLVIWLVIWLLIRDNFISNENPIASLKQKNPESLNQEMVGTEKASIALKDSNNLPGLKTDTPSLNVDEQKIILQELKKCFPNIKAISINPSDSFEEFLEKLYFNLRSEMGGPGNKLQDWHNVHLVLPTGKERRVRLYSDEDENGKLIQQLQFFSLDTEGLPEIIAIPPEDATNPSRETIQQYMESGDIKFEEKAFTETFSPSDDYLQTVERNGQTNQLEAHLGNRIFKCINNDCLCN